VRRWWRGAKRAGCGCLALLVLAAMWELPTLLAAAPSSLQAWTSAMVPTPPGLGNQVTFNALSCPSVGNCVAVGYSIAPDATGNASEAAKLSAPLAETLFEGKWTSSTPVAPSCGVPLASGQTCPTVDLSGTTVPNSVQSAVLTGISCSSMTSCVAVGDEVPLLSPDGNDQYGFAEVLSSSGWRPTAAFAYPTAKASGVVLSAISCVSATQCVAVGNDDIPGGQQGIAYELAGGTWTAIPDVNPHGPTDRTVTLQGVSCLSAVSCVAVGSYTKLPNFVQFPLSEVLSSGKWTTTLSSNPPYSFASALSGVSCTSTTFCEAVGWWQGSNSAQEALAETFSGSSWTPVTDLGHGDYSSNFFGISCTGRSACEAAGSYTTSPATPGAGSGSNNALIYTLSGSGWSETTGINPGGATNPAFSAVSCPQPGECIAVGGATTSGQGLGAFASAQSASFLTHFQIVTPTKAVTGTPITVSVFGLGASNDPAFGFSDRLRFNCTDVFALLPTNPALANGSGAFTVVFRVPGVQTVTVTDAANPALSGTSVPIDVTRATNVPEAPRVSASSGYGGIQIKWRIPNDHGYPITNYVVYRRQTQIGSSEVAGPLAVTTSTGYIDTTAGNGQRYYYTVAAMNAKGLSIASGQVNAIATGVLSGGHRFTSSWNAKGYWVNFPEGGVFGFGDTPSLGSLPVMRQVSPQQPIVGMATVPGGGGYWLVDSDGTVFSFGDARSYGSAISGPLSQPVVAMTSTPDGRGYWLVTANGTVDSFGDAPKLGSISVPLRQPVVAMAATPDGKGYWLATANGAVYAYGDASYYGSAAKTHLVQPIVGIAPTADGLGYYLVGDNGAVFAFGDAEYFGGLSHQLIMWPIIGMVTSISGKGYYLINTVGQATHFGQ
jgi:hypothetical protein